jgi:hypothetical protein
VATSPAPQPGHLAQREVAQLEHAVGSNADLDRVEQRGAASPRLRHGEATKRCGASCTLADTRTSSSCSWRKAQRASQPVTGLAAERVVRGAAEVDDGAEERVVDWSVSW